MWINGRYVVLQDEADAGAGAGAGGAGAGDQGASNNAAGGASAGDASQGNQNANANQGAGNQGNQGDHGAQSGAKWPDNWRQEFAGNDDKLVKRFERYNSPRDIANALIAAQNKISSGEFKAALPKDATEEQIKAWRAENGIPESPDKYDLTGLEIDEEDKEAVGELLKSAHQLNQTPEQVKAALQWHYDLKDKEAEVRENKDRELAQKTTDALHADWGNDYRPNMNLIHGLLDTVPGIKDKFLGGRMADGTPIGSDPEMLGFLALVARQINPVTTVVPGAGANIAGAIDDEIAKLEGLMGNRSSEYWKGPMADKNQARLRDLYSARTRMKKAS